MILPVHHALRSRLAAVLGELYGLDAAALPVVAIDYAPNRALGDLARPGRLRAGAPPAQGAARHRAGARRGARPPVPGVARVEAAPNGYLNFFLDRPAFLLARLDPAAAPARAADAAGKTIVEHTAINPNKAAHIGHLRNAALGDTLVRVLRFRGAPVEVQNYIDDTGVQVADVVVGFRELERTVARRGPRASPTRRGSTTTAGTSTRASPSGTTADKARLADPRRGAPRHRARRQRARRDRRRSSPTASSAATWRRWRG